MQSQNTEMQAFPMIETEILRPIVDLFLDKITLHQWANLEEGSHDRETKEIVTAMCVDIVNTISKYLLQLVEKRRTLTPPRVASSGLRKSQKSITEEEVQECVGESFSLTLADAMGVQQDIRCSTTETVTELVVKEVAERINSDRASQGEEPPATKGFSKRLKEMTDKVIKVMKKISKNMTCLSESTIESLVPTPRDTEAQPEEEEEMDVAVLSCGSYRALYTNLEEETIAPDSPKYPIFVTVKSILEEQAQDISVLDKSSDLSEEEVCLLNSSSDSDSENAAYSIVEVIWGDTEPEPEAEPDRDSPLNIQSEEDPARRKITRRIKEFFISTFAKESIISFFAKLRKRFSVLIPKSTKASMKLMIDGVGGFVEEMMSLYSDEMEMNVIDRMCLYRRMARDINWGLFELTEKRLAEFTFFHLSAEKKQKVHFMGFIKTEVDSFMKMMWNWLNQQAELHQRSSDNATAALRQIETFLEGTSTEEETVPAEPASWEHKGREKWDRLTLEILVTGLANRILKKVEIDHSNKAYQTAITTMTELLWAEMEDEYIRINLSPKNINKILNAVRKQLCKVGEELLWRCMLLEDPSILRHIADTLKDHLMTPRETNCVADFFESLFKTLTKPFTAIFKRG
ncbi:uncharacterized protein LOC117810083 isoform X2 [Notolabrus celidotus]|uniref:uncharacterized protein LOC117810083 isoform X2 n=1 Tax=Notolabrus celidotus TaxID=1203425 RepID=UPI00148F5973|nr:uncharacterized protein LOC117810083 isoform X2 [Notolabrus celidotus]